MIRIPGKIPVTIFPAYWIFTAILSLLIAEGNLFQALIWMIIIFVSILFHEIGHALTAKVFGRKPRIELVAMGGLTYHDGDQLPVWKQFLITLNGPLFGFILAIIADLSRSFVTSPNLQIILTQAKIVNIFWTIINLVPVLPLDGGQLLRLGMEKWFGFKGLRYTFIVSGGFALLASMALFLNQNLLPGAIFFLLAFENLSNFRRTRHIRRDDQRHELKEALMNGELLLGKGHKEEALAAFQSVRSATGEGMLHDAATQYCALILDQQGQYQAAYELLRPLQERLDPPMLLLLHRLAFDYQDDSIVTAIGPSVFQLFPLAEVALRNAYTAARLKQIEGAIGWLETAQQKGLENLGEIIKENAFDSVRRNPAFKRFVKKISLQGI